MFETHARQFADPLGSLPQFDFATLAPGDRAPRGVAGGGHGQSAQVAPVDVLLHAAERSALATQGAFEVFSQGSRVYQAAHFTHMATASKEGQLHGPTQHAAHE